MHGKVSFRLTNGDQPLILVPTLVNGEGPFDFVLDTGAGTSLLSPDLAQHIGIEPTESKEGAGAGGKVRVDMGRVQSLSVGQATVGDTNVGITHEVEKISACCGTKVDGILGYNFFRDFRLTIDYRTKTLALHRGQVYPELNGGNGARIAFHLAHPTKPLAVLNVLVNRRGPYPFILDTGASTSVVSSRLADELGLPYSEKPELTGGGGRVSASLARLSTLQVGSAELENVQVIVSDFLDKISQVIGTEIMGIVGYNYLRNFVVTVDYPGTTIGLSY